MTDALGTSRSVGRTWSLKPLVPRPLPVTPCEVGRVCGVPPELEGRRLRSTVASSLGKHFECIAQPSPSADHAETVCAVISAAPIAPDGAKSGPTSLVFLNVSEESGVKSEPSGGTLVRPVSPGRGVARSDPAAQGGAADWIDVAITGYVICIPPVPKTSTQTEITPTDDALRCTTAGVASVVVAKLSRALDKEFPCFKSAAPRGTTPQIIAASSVPLRWLQAQLTLHVRGGRFAFPFGPYISAKPEGLSFIPTGSNSSNIAQCEAQLSSAQTTDCLSPGGSSVDQNVWQARLCVALSTSVLQWQTIATSSSSPLVQCGVDEWRAFGRDRLSAQRERDHKRWSMVAHDFPLRDERPLWAQLAAWLVAGAEPCAEGVRVAQMCAASQPVACVLFDLLLLHCTQCPLTVGVQWVFPAPWAPPWWYVAWLCSLHRDHEAVLLAAATIFQSDFAEDHSAFCAEMLLPLLRAAHPRRHSHIGHGGWVPMHPKCADPGVCNDVSVRTSLPRRAATMTSAQNAVITQSCVAAELCRLLSESCYRVSEYRPNHLGDDPNQVEAAQLVAMRAATHILGCLAHDRVSLRLSFSRLCASSGGLWTMLIDRCIWRTGNLPAYIHRAFQRSLSRLPLGDDDNLPAADQSPPHGLHNPRPVAGSDVEVRGAGAIRHFFHRSDVAVMMKVAFLSGCYGPFLACDKVITASSGGASSVVSPLLVFLAPLAAITALPEVIDGIEAACSRDVPTSPPSELARKLVAGLHMIRTQVAVASTKAVRNAATDRSMPVCLPNLEALVEKARCHLVTTLADEPVATNQQDGKTPAATATPAANATPSATATTWMVALQSLLASIHRAYPAAAAVPVDIPQGVGDLLAAHLPWHRSLRLLRDLSVVPISERSVTPMTYLASRTLSQIMVPGTSLESLSRLADVAGKCLVVYVAASRWMRENEFRGTEKCTTLLRGGLTLPSGITEAGADRVATLAWLSHQYGKWTQLRFRNGTNAASGFDGAMNVTRRRPTNPTGPKLHCSQRQLVEVLRSSVAEWRLAAMAFNFYLGQAYDRNDGPHAFLSALRCARMLSDPAISLSTVSLHSAPGEDSATSTLPAASSSGKPGGGASASCPWSMIFTIVDSFVASPGPYSVSGMEAFWKALTSATVGIGRNLGRSHQEVNAALKDFRSRLLSADRHAAIAKSVL